MTSLQTGEVHISAVPGAIVFCHATNRAGDGGAPTEVDKLVKHACKAFIE
jgi:hypothetical protein